MALDTPCQGFLSTWLRKALRGQPLEIYGDGRQLRDPLYVDDVVDAMLLAGGVDAPGSRSYNVGGPEPLALSEIADTLSRLAGLPAPAWRDFPEERKAIDIGSYYTDSTLIREQLRWTPSIRLEEGMRRTLAWYHDTLDRYLDPASPDPTCKLGHLRSTLPAVKTVPTV
jgi:nucleoside-diphosphate-sugar epimerase